MIVLNKSQFAENALKTKDLGKKPSETLYLIAGYYFKNGLDAGQVRKKLNEFIIQSAPDAMISKWSATVDYAIKRAKKYPIVDIESIPIYEEEMGVIDSLEGVMLKKLAFTLLVLAKYWNTVKDTDDSWVTNDDSEIMRIANISANLRKQSLLYHKLHEQCLIAFSKKVDNTSVQVLYVNESGASVLDITDLRNLGYQYLKYSGEPYFVCENCGVTTKLNSKDSKKPQKYCKSCAAQIAMKQRINSVMRSRGKAQAV